MSILIPFSLLCLRDEIRKNKQTKLFAENRAIMAEKDKKSLS